MRLTHPNSRDGNGLCLWLFVVLVMFADLAAFAEQNGNTGASTWLIEVLQERGPGATARYPFSFTFNDRSSDPRIRHKGAELMQRLEITLPQKPQSELIVYQRIRE